MTLLKNMLKLLSVFDDTGSNIQYQAVDFDIDDTVLANDVTVTRIRWHGSKHLLILLLLAEFFERNYNRTGLIMDTDADALLQAQFYS